MLLQQCFDFLHEVRLLSGTYVLVNHFASFDEEHSGHVANAELGRKVVVLVHIAFANVHFAFVFGSEFINDGCNLLAGAAPGG